MTHDDRLIRKKLLTLLNSEELVDRYIKQFGAEITFKNIKTLKTASKESGQMDPSSGDGQDPVFLIKVRCPVCDQANIPSSELKAKSQAITFDRFMVPRYTGAPGFKTIQYNWVAVTVCPRCLFASPDKKDFNTYSMTTHSEQRSQLGAMVVSRLKESIAARKDLLDPGLDAEEFFRIPRVPEAVVLSYQLAIHRAQVEAEMERPYSFFKAGAYALRIAQLHRDRKDAVAEEDGLRQALGFYEQCFTSSNAPSQDLENQVIYVIVALHLRLGNERQARSYIAVLDKIRSEAMHKAVANPAAKAATVEVWEGKAKILWEDRELPDLWVRGN